MPMWFPLYTFIALGALVLGRFLVSVDTFTGRQIRVYIRAVMVFYIAACFFTWMISR